MNFNDFSLVIAKYNASLPTLSDGQIVGLQVDVNGRLLVQSDVSVVIDFLGLNGASDSSNILMVGTEDGTSGGTAHAVRLSSNGSVVIDDGGSSITVDAVDFDIRDLSFASDSVDVSGSEVSLDAATLAALENITVSATDLDIRDLVFATDKVDVSGSEVSLDAATLAALENITVSATDLDIRDLAFATDKVDVSGSEVSLDAATLAALENITVSATDLDIRDLAFATDKVDVSGSEVSLDAATLAALENITVSATDLDIRDLSHVSDSVKIGDGTDFLAINTDGSINVAATVSYDGVEAYNATDDLAAGADGLVTITAAATPWVDAVSVAVGAGQVMHMYGFDWTADQGCNARVITDDGTDIVVYKHSLNSSAQPDQFKYFGEAGRIEIAGSATLNVKIQIKKRSSTGGNAQGHASIFSRIV